MNKQIHKTDRKVYLLYTMGCPKDDDYLMNAAENEDGPTFSSKKSRSLFKTRFSLQAPGLHFMLSLYVGLL